MRKLIYTAITSLDGFIEDADGKFDWAAPDEEVHAFVNDLERSVGTYLYGRRMYETMVYWESPPGVDEQSAAVREFAVGTGKRALTVARIQELELLEQRRFRNGTAHLRYRART
jgi:dihydrofolate reductase